MKSEIENKILDILFKGEVVADSMSKLLLPEIIINPEIRDDFSLEDMVKHCRHIVKSNIQKILED